MKKLMLITALLALMSNTCARGPSLGSVADWQSQDYARGPGFRYGCIAPSGLGGYSATPESASLVSPSPARL